MQIFLRIPLEVLAVDQVNAEPKFESQVAFINWIHSYAKSFQTVSCKEEIGFLSKLLEYYDVQSVNPKDYPDFV